MKCDGVGAVVQVYMNTCDQNDGEKRSETLSQCENGNERIFHVSKSLSERQRLTAIVVSLYDKNTSTVELLDSVQVILAIMQLISGVHLNFKLRHCMSFAISADDEQVFRLPLMSEND